MRLRTWILCAIALGMGISSALAAAPAAGQASLPEFNQLVLKVLKEYPTDGTHGYWWPRSGEGDYDGCTRDLYFLGQKVMKGEEKGRTYCCGLTLEVFLEAYNRWLKDHGGEKFAALKPEDWPRFKRLWFVEKHNGPGPSSALEAFQMGKTIPAEAALPGDFIQIWRTPNEKGKETGHSVIFLDWTRDEEGKIAGIRYWSTQPGTQGISEREEFYGPNGGVSAQTTWFGRVALTRAEQEQENSPSAAPEGE